ncbi:MAG: DegT/DnrJ/EryC1/StrS aminotransferase family protein [Chloroflexota bacterium]|nr:DegT/DnrJ/EryC1/StrS aminotransferase family protein [Chloroflexota bacterium]
MRIPPAKIHIPEEDRTQILAAIDACLASGQLTLGKHGAAFEEAFARTAGTTHAIATSSGTSALEIIFRAIGVAGGEVIVPTNTFFATPAAVEHAGGVVRFAECDPATFSIDVDHVRSLLGPKTRAVVVVHIGGVITPRIAELQGICARAGVPLVEDAAHAHGSTLGGKPAGSFGIAAAFSFYPTKVITAGEGGMIATSDDRIDEQARVYRDQGKAGFTSNFHTLLGNNWRLSEPHAIIGGSQLARLPEFIAARQRVAAVYDRLLAGTGVEPLRIPEGSTCNYYKYIAMPPAGVDRSALKKTLRERYDVGLSGEVYEAPCHLQPVFGPQAAGSLPVAEELCSRHICLPVSAVMPDDDAAYVVESLVKALAEQRVATEA